MSIIKLLYLLLLFVCLTGCWQKMWGDNDLGNNFSLLEGDRIEDRIIVLCSGRSAGACIAGTPVLPVYPRHIDSTGKYAEYVETATSNDKFIIARTFLIKSQTSRYWIISKDFTRKDCAQADCDSIIQSHLFGPFDQAELNNKMVELNIVLPFEDN